MANRKVLFVCHSASRNGATIVLLHFLRWLKTIVDWEIDILVQGRGPLLDDLRQCGRVTVWRNPARAVALMPSALGHKIATVLETPLLNALFVGRRYDIIYANTVATWHMVRMLRTKAARLVWHVHELHHGLATLLAHPEANRLFKSATQYIAVSTSVHDALKEQYEIDQQKIALVHEFIAPDTSAQIDQTERRRGTLRELGWPEDAFVIGGCGAPGWRKGTDLFLQIAKTLVEELGAERVRFLWVGGENGDSGSREFAYDAQMLGLSGFCARVANTPDVIGYYAAMNTFALTSREDPFPLVMLEAAAQRVPLVCFERSGGGPEFAGQGAGVVAPYLDIAIFAARIKELMNDRAQLCSLGDVASNLVQNHYSVDTQAPKLWEVVQRLLRTS